MISTLVDLLEDSSDQVREFAATMLRKMPTVELMQLVPKLQRVMQSARSSVNAIVLSVLGKLPHDELFGIIPNVLALLGGSSSVLDLSKLAKLSSGAIASHSGDLAVSQNWDLQ